MCDEARRPGHLTCPKCGDAMETVVYEDVEVDRCRGCRGIFFDICEHEDLRKIAGAEALDDGSEKIGTGMDAKRDIRCPVCDTAMLGLVALRQRDFAYEKCPRCSGVFFDAGELRAFKEDKSFLQSVREILAEAGAGRSR